MRDLIEKYITGKISKEEEVTLYHWVEENPEQMDFFKQMIYEYSQDGSNNIPFDTKDSFLRLKSKLQLEPKVKAKKVFFQNYYKYAAIFILLLAGIFFVRFLLQTENKELVPIVAKEKEDHSKRIILTLSNGTEKVIGEEEELISYTNEEPSKQLEYNQIQVPRGEVFQIILSDDTKVWLNADTKIKYPKFFLDSESTRTVYLEGEAFFEVSHNKEKPFFVEVNGMNVEVLGTKFNVSSYAQQKNIETTLVEGSVRVTDTSIEKNIVVLEPYEQAVFNKNENKISTQKVDVDYYTAWIHKKIIFRDTPLLEIFEKIERVYNVEIINHYKPLENIKFTGEFDIEDVEVIFKALSTSKTFSYEIEDRRIIINQ